MKKTFTLLFIFLFISSSFGQIKKTSQLNLYRPIKTLDVNNIKMKLNNLGQLYHNNGAHWDAINYRDYITGENLNWGNGIVISSQIP